MPRAAPWLALLAIVLPGCLTGNPAEPVDVVATIYPLAYLAERIAGTHLEILQLVPPGVEPHDWEPTPRDIAAVRDSKVLLSQGAGIDPWVGRVATDLGKRGPTTHALTVGMTLRERDGQPDPHTWLDPVLYGDHANRVYGILGSSYNGLFDDFEPAYATLAADLDALDREYAEGLADCERRVIVANHDAFSYPAARYNFTVLAITGLSPEAEPDVRTLNELAEKARAANVTIVFFEELVDPRVAEVLADEIGATTRVLSPIETLTDEAAAAGKDYLALQRDNLANLREAMSCR